jgi:pimeloyl-ACP methyl ester carboxylesterase
MQFDQLVEKGCSAKEKSRNSFFVPLIKLTGMRVLLLLLLSTSLFAGAQSNPAGQESPVTLTTSTGEIHGTLLMPHVKHAVPVALIIAGSGPTDRNGNNPWMKNESLRMVAEGLARNGIASLRYDKRGIGESAKAMKSEADLRFDDYINDARGWIGLLKKDARFTRVYVIGHSEGSMIGMVAAQSGAQAFVSLAGAGRPVQVVLKEQLASQPKNVMDSSYAIIDSLSVGKTVARVNPTLFVLFRPSIQPYLISWMKYDPVVEVRKLKMPVLIVQGSADLQVKEEDARQLKAARPDAALFLSPKMNHVLKTVENEQENKDSYKEPDRPLTEGLIEAIARFLKRGKKK